MLLKYPQGRWCSVTIVQVEAKPVESRVEISSVQHAAFHCFLNVLSLKFEFLQGCVQVLQAPTKTLPILYYVTEITTEVKGKVHLYQQLFVCKSPRDGPSVPIFLSEVIDELDNFLLQISFNVNLYVKWSNPTYWEIMLFWLFKNDSQKYLSKCWKLGNDNNNCNWLNVHTLRIDLSTFPPVSIWAVLLRL